jgi:hypothetical protein
MILLNNTFSLIDYESGHTICNSFILGGTKMVKPTVKLIDYAGKKEFDLKNYLSQLISLPLKK